MLMHYIPVIKPVMRYIGAAYILWLAWTVWRDKKHKNGGAALRGGDVYTGILMQFVNVKVILYGITVFSTFILPYYRSPVEILIFILLITVIGFSANLCWVLFGTVFQRVFTHHKKALNAVMALLLVYCAVSILIHQ